MKVKPIKQKVVKWEDRCDRRDHWDNILIWGECSGSCGLGEKRATVKLEGGLDCPECGDCDRECDNCEICRTA